MRDKLIKLMADHNLTKQDMVEITGYSFSAISEFRAKNPRRPLTARAWVVIVTAVEKHLAA